MKLSNFPPLPVFTSKSPPLCIRDAWVGQGRTTHGAQCLLGSIKFPFDLIWFRSKHIWNGQLGQSRGSVHPIFLATAICHPWLAAPVSAVAAPVSCCGTCQGGKLFLPSSNHYLPPVAPLLCKRERRCQVPVSHPSTDRARHGLTSVNKMLHFRCAMVVVVLWDNHFRYAKHVLRQSLLLTLSQSPPKVNESKVCVCDPWPLKLDHLQPTKPIFRQAYFYFSKARCIISFLLHAGKRALLNEPQKVTWAFKLDHLESTKPIFAT